MNWKKLLCKISQHRPSDAMLPGLLYRRRCDRCGCVLGREEIWVEVTREQLIAEELMKDEAARDGHQYDSGGPQGWQGFQGVQGNVGNQGSNP